MTPSRSAHGARTSRCSPNACIASAASCDPATTVPARSLSSPLRRLRSRCVVLASRPATRLTVSAVSMGAVRPSIPANPKLADGESTSGSHSATVARVRNVFEVAQTTSQSRSRTRSAREPSMLRACTRRAVSSCSSGGSLCTKRRVRRVAPRGRLSAISGCSPSPPATSRLPPPMSSTSSRRAEKVAHVRAAR